MFYCFNIYKQELKKLSVGGRLCFEKHFQFTQSIAPGFAPGSRPVLPSVFVISCDSGQVSFHIRGLPVEVISQLKKCNL